MGPPLTWEPGACELCFYRRLITSKPQKFSNHYPSSVLGLQALEDHAQGVTWVLGPKLYIVVMTWGFLASCG